MKPTVAIPLKLAASLSLGVAGVIGAAYVASFAMADYSPHRFAHMDAPLWTDKPVLVEREGQGLERLPALAAAADVPAQEGVLGYEIASAANAVSPRGPLGSSPMGSDAESGMAEMVADRTDTGGIELSAAHVDWCFARYRSYRIEDNSYQPFDASERRQCQSPHQADATVAELPAAENGSQPMEQVVLDERARPADEPQMVADSGAVDVSWCYAQYRSYRAEDNTYQPFDGGPRRQCVPRGSSY